MRYEDFRATWDAALRDAGFLSIGPPNQTFDTESCTKKYQVFVEPRGGQDGAPFHVTATLSFSWDALKTARTATSEEDMLTTLFGRAQEGLVDTEAPWLRVDVKLNASLAWGKPLPMPTPGHYRRWAREVTARLEKMSPLLPEETVRETHDGDLEVLGYKDDPELRVKCDGEGVLWLTSVALSGWEAITLPRLWSDFDRHDDDPREALDQMFARVRAALHAWMECLDHLTAVPKAAPAR